MTHITLRTAGDPGMYYKARIGCDETLAKLITGYGTALSLKAMPDKNFANAEDVKYTAFDREAFVAAYADNQVLTNSCILTGVLKGDNTISKNSVNVKQKVYANVYLNVTLDGSPVILLADEDNAGKSTQNRGFNGIAYSLKNLVDGMHNNWVKYSVANRSAMRKFIKNWSNSVYADIFPVHICNRIKIDAFGIREKFFRCSIVGRTCHNTNLCSFKILQSLLLADS